MIKQSSITVSHVTCDVFPDEHHQISVHYQLITVHLIAYTLAHLQTMAKRQLGIGKAKKKQKLESKAESDQPQAEDASSASGKGEETSNELTVELPENIDANDEFGELKGLWDTYKSKGNELILNGIIHECDRLIRNHKQDSSNDSLPDYFYNIYGLSLFDLVNYKPEEVDDALQLAIEKFELGLEKYPEDPDLLVNHLRLLLHELFNDIQKLTLDSTEPEIQSKLNKSLTQYEAAETLSQNNRQYSIFNESTFEVIQLVDDLLEVVDTFRQEEDNEDEEDQEPVELSMSHPLYPIRESDQYNEWWRNHILIFLDNLTKQVKHEPKNQALAQLLKTINKLIGQLYLKEAEEPSNIFTTLTYDDSYTQSTINGLDKETSRKIGIDLFKQSIAYLRDAWDNDEPETWVLLAESLISLGNLYELDSKDQSSCYDEAEQILTKANNVTNGKYKEILDNLIG